MMMNGVERRGCKSWDYLAWRRASPYLGDIQNSARQGPAQPALADLALSRGVGPDGLQRQLPASTPQ